ncbi:PA2169 family four-helix-bundle protein [Chitinophaga sp. XS-30]|uniref:PA2169 family four-helix-bundle protein n=1 Tax=Chitinophaga sp. XS-30 TaxID=2604421 RepID=UPI0011DD3E16|nr:PA2169 family four-helix-bundle protein [Chitinophaga sp. XS-30]QEH39685.1 PA2169 family four-helix-bundle protein [Chitinophaga sp. XS-30]
MEKTTTNDTIEVLNDLVAINNDRIAGYEKALEELAPEDADLRSLFADMIRESHDMRNALGTEVQVCGGEMETGTTNSGKIYRTWMDVKAVFTGHDRHAVLASCEAGEDAAQRAYESALTVEDMPDYLRQILVEQKQILRVSHDRVKALRDQAK